MGRCYTVTDARPVSAAGTLLQAIAPASTALTILRVWLTQSSSTASAHTEAVLLRKTSSITGTPITPVRTNPGDPASVVTWLRTATAEGTDGDTVAGEGFNALTGWLWIPVEEERPIVAPGGMIALTFSVIPPAATWRYGVTYREIS